LIEDPIPITGRVLRAERGGCLVITDTGVVRATYPNQCPPGDWPPTTGDFVSLSEGSEQVVTGVAPRRSTLQRNDPSDTGQQVLAANVDVVLVLAALDRPAKPGRIERFLVMVWDGGALPVVVLTKADLVSPDTAGDRHREALLAAGSADVVVVSAATGAGLEHLDRHLIPGRTVALLGESGVGKSTLANRLAGAEVMATADTRRDAKGRHTTTVRELVPLPGGAVLLDTPGLRSVGLWEGGGGVESVFADVAEIADGCRFRDCRHGAEPGCAVVAAIASGDLEQRRLDSYRKLQREQQYVAARNDVRTQRAAARAAGRRYRRVRKERPDKR
jgi:ribosome biogenesis GTPase / thiamine phosphate phosphatase